MMSVVATLDVHNLQSDPMKDPSVYSCNYLRCGIENNLKVPISCYDSVLLSQ